MAWLHNRKRKNRRTGRMETYWSLCWRAEGRTHTRAIGFLSKADAERALKVFEGKVAEGDTAVLRISGLSSSGPKRRAPTLRDYLDDIYLPVVERDKAPKTVETERNAAKALKGEMGNLRLDEINFAVVDAYLSVRKQAGRKSRTLILEVRTLSKALRHAHACEAQNIFFMLFIEHRHGVIDGNHTDEPLVFVHHGRGNQVILVEGIGDVFFRLKD